MKNKKLTKQELSEIQDIQTRMQAVKTELGQIALTEIDIRNNKSAVENYLTETRQMETTLAKALEDKYGKGTVDLQNGEFIPAESQNTAKIVPTVE